MPRASSLRGVCLCVHATAALPPRPASLLPRSAVFERYDKTADGKLPASEEQFVRMRGWLHEAIESFVDARGNAQTFGAIDLGSAGSAGSPDLVALPDPKLNIFLRFTTGGPTLRPGLDAATFDDEFSAAKDGIHVKVYVDPNGTQGQMCATAGTCSRELWLPVAETKAVFASSLDSALKNFAVEDREVGGAEFHYQ